jgi:hypothetical protein
MKASLASLAVMAAFGLASLPAQAAFVPFTVNETVVDANTAGAPSFSADKMTGSYSELLGLTSATTFSAAAVGRFGSYNTNGGADPVLDQLLTATPSAGETNLNRPLYNMYARFIASGTAVSNTQFIGTGGYLEIWIDPSRNTVFSGPGGAGYNDFTVLPTAQSGSGEDLLVGTSSVSFGSGDLIGPPGAFNIYFEEFTLTAFGATYWTGINTMNFVLQTNGDIDGINPNPGANPPPYVITGDFSANFSPISEPGALLLVGAALTGLGFQSRRRKAK